VVAFSKNISILGFRFPFFTGFVVDRAPVREDEKEAAFASSISFAAFNAFFKDKSDGKSHFSGFVGFSNRTSTIKLS
jgi:hypothetical protein